MIPKQQEYELFVLHLIYVRENQAPHNMPIQKYDIPILMNKDVVLKNAIGALLIPGL